MQTRTTSIICIYELSLVMVIIMVGNFSGPKQQEIVVAKGNILELLRPDDTGKVISINSTNVFSIIRSLYPFRSTGLCVSCLIITKSVA
jgi:hypothetical protein